MSISRPGAAHSHDEIITECSFDNAELMVTRLRGSCSAALPGARACR